MYFVDREKVEATLRYLEQHIQLFSSKQEWSTPLEQAALERSCHMMIETILDVGNAMIDGFIMRDPGSYDDIIDILIDERVVSLEMGEHLKQLISFRKKLVQEYIEIDHRALVVRFSEHLPALMEFSGNVRAYLTHELGPVSAFKN